MYEDVTFPTFRYNSSNVESAKRFNTLAELQAAGPGWLDSPDRFLIVNEADVIGDDGEITNEAVKADVIEAAVAVPPETPEEHAPAKNILMGSGSFGETAPAEPPPGLTEVPAEGVDVAIEVLREEAKSLGIRGNVNVFKRETLIKKIENAKATE